MVGRQAKPSRSGSVSAALPGQAGDCDGLRLQRILWGFTAYQQPIRLIASALHLRARGAGMIKRFYLDAVSNDDGFQVLMVEHRHGDFVSYEDHQTRVDELIDLLSDREVEIVSLEERIADLVEEVQELREAEA